MAETDDLPMSFSSPESSVVKGASYDPTTRVLTVELPDGDYRYSGVDLALWEDFLAAESKGSYFSKRIRPLFHGMKRA